MFFSTFNYAPFFAKTQAFFIKTIVLFFYIMYNDNMTERIATVTAKTTVATAAIAMVIRGGKAKQ